MAAPAGGYLSSAPGFEPPYTTADEIALDAEADNLDGIAGRITGHGADLRSTLEAGAVQFSDLVADPVRAHGTDALQSTQQVTGAAVFGSTVLRALAGDVGRFKHTVHDLVERWRDGQANNFGQPADATPAQVDRARERLHTELMTAARRAKDHLEESADTHGGMLSSGPTSTALKALTSAGFIGWASFNLFGDNNVATEKAIEALRDTANGRLDPRRLRDLQAVVDSIGRDPQAANRLLVQMRPIGLLRAWGNIVYSGDASARLQEGLGRILALGTRPGMHTVSVKWRRECLAQITEPITLDLLVDDQKATLPGGLLLAPLLEHGRYDIKFLLSAADGVHDAHPRLSAAGIGGVVLSPAHPEFGNDPLNSVLAGLANNPRTATAFFGADTDPSRLDRIPDLLSRTGSGSARPGAGTGSAPSRIDPTVLDQALTAARTGRPVGDDRQRHVEPDAPMRAVARRLTECLSQPANPARTGSLTSG